MPAGRKRRAPPTEDTGTEEENSDPHIGTTHRRHQQESPTSTDFAPNDNELEGVQEDDDNYNQLVKKFIRYALACEYSRQPIKRSEVNSKVLGPYSRQFKTVFIESQRQLRWIFGMELLELPLKEKITISQRRAAQKSENHVITSNAWILTSALPHEYRIPLIVPPPKIPTVDVEASYVGLYTFIISLIFLAGGQLPEAKLERYLRRANADQSTPIDRTDKMLNRMVKEGYIVRIKENVDGEETIDYRVGPRGRVEVGEAGVATMVKIVYGDSATEGLEKRIERSLGLADMGRSAQHGGGDRDEIAKKGRGKPRWVNASEHNEEETES